MSLFQEACGAVGPLKVSIQHADGRPRDHREFDQPFLVIGRETKTDLPLNDKAVSYRHAYLQVIAGQVFCIDLFARTGVRWGNGSRPSGWLTPDQPIGIGPFTIQLPNAPHPNLNGAIDPLASRSRDQDPLPPVSLEILLENQTVVWPMNRVVALVGQEQRCKVHLKAAGVSSTHCSLVRTPMGLWVVDLNSSGGTKLNGAPVRYAHLVDGDELRIGEMRLRVNYSSARQSGGSSSSSLSPASGVFVQTSDELEKLRTQVEELTRALSAAEEDRAGLIRSAEDETRRWETERQTLRQEREVEQTAVAERQAQDETKRQRVEAELATLRTELATQRQDAAQLNRATAERATLEAEFQKERQTFQGQVAALLQEAAVLEQRSQTNAVRVDTNSDQQRKALRDEVDRLKREVEGLRSEREQMVVRLSTADADLDAIRADSSAKEQDRLRELTALREELAQFRQTAQEEADPLRRACDDAVAKHDDMARQIAELRDEAEGIRSKVETDRRRFEDERTKLGQTHDEELQKLRDEANAARNELSEVQKQVESATAETENRVQQRVDELAAARRDFDRERQTLHAELNQFREASEARRAELEEQAAQAKAREGEHQAQLNTLHEEMARERQALSTDADGLRQDLDSLRVELAQIQNELATKEQQGQADLSTLRSRADEERKRLSVDLDKLRVELSNQQTAAAAQLERARTELTTVQSQYQSERTALESQLAALRQESERGPAIASNPVLDKLLGQFRVAVERFDGLVGQVEGLYGELRERSQRSESKRGVFSRFLGGSREADAETNVAVERRLATLRAETTIEQERTALIASEAARADLERQLTEARRKLAALSGQSN